MNISTHILPGFSPDQMKAINDAVALLQRVCEQEDFIQVVSGMGQPLLVQNYVYGPMTLTLKPWRPWNPFTSATASTPMNQGPIGLGPKAFKQDTAALANTIAHEYTHVLGFGHPLYYTPERIHTVPYAVGELVESIARRLG